MPSRYRADVPSQRVTPPEVFFNRRRFLAALGGGLLAAPGALRAAAPGSGQTPQAELLDVPFQRPDVFPAERNADYALPRRILQPPLIDPPTSPEWAGPKCEQRARPEKPLSTKQEDG